MSLSSKLYDAVARRTGFRPQGHFVGFPNTYTYISLAVMVGLLIFALLLW